MAEEKWQLEAIGEQFNIFSSLTKPSERINQADFQHVVTKIETIIKQRLRTNQETKSPKEVSSGIIEKARVNECTSFAFAVIVTNIELNKRLIKMPVFVLISGDQKIFIDMNCTLFKSWKAFLKNNHLPSCQFCFPVDGQYSVGRKMEIGFASSPAALRANMNAFQRSLDWIITPVRAACSFFFSISPINHRFVQNFVNIATEFVCGITRRAGDILGGLLRSIQQFTYEKVINITIFLSEMYANLKALGNELCNNIRLVYRRVREELGELYFWIRGKFSNLFGSASDESQHAFLAVASKVDADLKQLDLETEELLEASRRNNHLAIDTAELHSQVKTEEESELDQKSYVQNIFKNSHTESNLKVSGMEKKVCTKLSNTTMDLLKISNNLANILEKTNLKDAQDIFESLSCIVQDEYRHKIGTYTQMLSAARVSAGHELDLEAFNQALNIEGDPKEHYWKEAVKCTFEPRLAFRVQDKLKELETKNIILLVEMWKRCDDDIEGIYRSFGVSGTGMFTADDLIKTLKEMSVRFNEDLLVVNETASMIFIQAENVTIVAQQELNSENTSVGTVYIVKSEL